MKIDELTIGEAKELAAMFGAHTDHAGINGFCIDAKVIVRTYAAGVWFGNLKQKAGKEVVLDEARRMWKWKANGGICLSSCATDGIDADKSRISAPVSSVWLEAIEILPCSALAVKSIGGARHASA